nr:MAG: polyprotein [Picornaviridae sp.]
MKPKGSTFIFFYLLYYLRLELGLDMENQQNQETSIPDFVTGEVISTAKKFVDTVSEPISELIPSPGVQHAVIKSQSGTTIKQGSHNLTLTTGDPTKEEVVPQIETTAGSSDDFTSCSYEVGTESENISKYIWLKSAGWPTAAAPRDVLCTIWVPADFVKDDSHPGWGQAGYFTWFRAGITVQLQISVPLGYAGALVMTYVPNCQHNYFPEAPANQHPSIGSKGLDASTILSLPHVILDVANESVATLTVPYVNSTNYAGLHTNSHEGGKIVIWNLTNLMTPTGEAQTVTFSVYGKLNDLDFQCPQIWAPDNVLTDFGRKIPKKKPLPDYTPVTKFDANRQVIIQPGLGTWNASNSKVLNLAESVAIASEQSFVDLKTAGSAAAIQDLVELGRRWTIVAIQDWSTETNPGAEIKGYKMSELMEQGVFGMLLSAFGMWRGSIEIKVLIYAAKNVHGRLQVTWMPTRNENNSFSLAQARNGIILAADVHGPDSTMVLPFSYYNWRKPVRTPYGRLQIHVLNKLTRTGAGATQAKVVLLMRYGEDFQLFAPDRPALQFKEANPNEPAQPAQQGTEDEPSVFINFDTRSVDLHTASHSSIDAVFGRAWYVGDVEANNSAQKINLTFPRDALQNLGTLMAYWSGEIAITISTGRDNAIAAHSYVQLRNTGRIALQDLLSAGAILIPPRSFKTFLVPFYSTEPLRRTLDNETFGYLYISTASRATVFMALKSSNFFFPIAMRQTEPQLTGASARHFSEACSGRMTLHPRTIHQTGEWRKKSSWIRDLTEEGIEPNPGPQLVWKDRGLYKHYGVKIGDQVLHLSSENILSSIVKGTAKPQLTKFDDSWSLVGPQVYQLAKDYAEADALPAVHFSIDENCETFAMAACEISEAWETQGEKIKKALTICLAAFVVTGAVSLANQSGLGDSVLQFLTKITTLVYGGFQTYVVKIVVKTVIRLICYLIMYCHCPNLLTTGVLVTLVTLDCVNTELDPSVKKLVEAIVQGDFKLIAKHVAKEAGVDETFQPKQPEGESPFHNQSAKDFNTISLAAKNVRWWFESLMEVFNWIREKVFPSNLAEAIDLIEEHKDQIATTLALADQHICLMMTDKKYAVDKQTRVKHTELCDMISGIQLTLQDLPRVTPLHSRVNQLATRLAQISFEPTVPWSTRPEPVGIWVSGTAGVGKSFLVTKLCGDLAKKYGWSCYSNPSGSNHMDGYTDQEVHLFDDFGQNAEEEDYALICQLISSCPFIVPKADVTAKGTAYNAKVVLVTTNRFSFESHKLFDKEALARRFPFVLKIKPREQFAVNGKFDVVLAEKMGALDHGNCWMRDLACTNYTSTAVNTKWEPMDYDILFDEICDAIDTRQRIASSVAARFCNQGWQDFKNDVKQKFKKAEKKVEKKVAKSLFISLDEPSSFFDSDKVCRTARVIFGPPPQTIKEKCLFMLKEAVISLKKFLDKHRTWIMAIGALGSIISIGAVIMGMIRNKKNQEEGVYNPGTTVRLTRDFARAATEHFKNQGRLDFKSVTKHLYEVGYKKHTATALAVSAKELVTYGHDAFDHCKFQGENHPFVKTFTCTFEGQPMDLQIMQVGTNLQFKSGAGKIFQDDYKGNGFLVWKIDSEVFVQPVSDIKPMGRMVTSSGTISTHTYIYTANTGVGSCGGILTGVVNGNLVILGIHTAGSGNSGMANRISLMHDQGVRTCIQVFDKPLYHQPRQTQLRPSPLYTSSEMAPAVLSKNDPRLVDWMKIDDVTDLAAAKYLGNIWNPPLACLEAAKAWVTSRIRPIVGTKSTISYELATSEFVPMDWSTSPGLKYKGRNKRQLVADEQFKKDVEKQLEQPGTYFTTYLKDELRPLDKIKIGKTRAIEACNFDYTIAYRMVMGGVYKKIYQDGEAYSGLAVGICPYTHWAGLVSNLKKYSLCLDFKGFDGSLPPELLRAGVEILASCHEDPEMVRKIHEPTIVSTNYVSNKIYLVDGGMCSGSPCTTVLNSICNNIAAVTVALSCGAAEDDLYVVSYGDDLIISVDEKFDLTMVTTYYFKFFGMTVTNTKKSDKLEWVDTGDAEFLKRKTGIFQPLNWPVGVLDLKNMLDKIQWTRGHFDQQMYSFCLELVLHGPEVYNAIRKQFMTIDPGMHIPTYFEMECKMKSIILGDPYIIDNYPTSCRGKLIIDDDQIVCSKHQDEGNICAEFGQTISAKGNKSDCFQLFNQGRGVEISDDVDYITTSYLIKSMTGFGPPMHEVEWNVYENLKKTYWFLSGYELLDMLDKIFEKTRKPVFQIQQDRALAAGVLLMDF